MKFLHQGGGADDELQFKWPHARRGPSMRSGCLTFLSSAKPAESRLRRDRNVRRPSPHRLSSGPIASFLLMNNKLSLVPIDDSFTSSPHKLFRICNPPVASAQPMTWAWRITNPPTPKFGIANLEQHKVDSSLSNGCRHLRKAGHEVFYRRCWCFNQQPKPLVGSRNCCW
jgi:hypothetical protein